MTELQQQNPRTEKVVVQTSLPNIEQSYPHLHERAKAGNIQAALSLVLSVLKEDRLHAFDGVSRDALFLPVIAEERTGNNALPRTYARVLAEQTGHDVSLDIVQSVRANHTGASKETRFLRQPEFEGLVEYGREYILVDDHVTQGGTLNALRRFIEGRGGIVAGITTLSASAGATVFNMTEKVYNQLKEADTDGQLERALRDEFGFARGFQDLTNQQGFFLRTAKNRETILSHARRDGRVDTTGEAGRRMAESGAARTAQAYKTVSRIVDIPLTQPKRQIYMREKTAQEKAASDKQVTLLVDALERAKNGGGYWLNTAGRMAPRFYPKGVAVSPFNSLVMGLHCEQEGHKTPLYTTFKDAKNEGAAVLAKMKSVPFYWYKWENYVNRNNPEDRISRNEYKTLPQERQTQYKGVRAREVRQLFNIDQTTLPLVDKELYQALVTEYGVSELRNHSQGEDAKLRIKVNDFQLSVRDNLVPIRRDTSGVARYDTQKDAVYMPEQKHFQHYNDYVQELMRQVVTATGHQQRLAREGLVMKGGKAPSEDALKHELLVCEIASGIKMQELGLPAKLSPEGMKHIEYWQRELKESPCLIDAIESDVNAALDMMKKAENGEKVILKTQEHQQKIQQEQEKRQPQVNAAECAILLDIIRYGGMKIDDRNFASIEEKEEFMEKFGLTYYEGQKNYALGQTGSEDPDIVEIAYTQAVSEGQRIAMKCREYMPSDWNTRSANYQIADAISGMPNKDSREMVIVRDTQTNIADVILPACAMAGGKVTLPDGESKPYYLTPDEVMSEDERNKAGARIVKNDMQGFSKERIENAMLKNGCSYVRFFNNDGALGYRPDDGYFVDKVVSVVKLKGWEIQEQSKMDIAEAVKKATTPRIDSLQMLRDDNGRWAMFMKPHDEAGFCVYPDKTDLNQFFSTIKQGKQDECQALREELATKYYMMAQNDPKLKFDIFDMAAEKADTDRITHVSIFRTRDEKLMILPTIEGMNKLYPREITPSQWQRLWIAPDMDAYKTSLAAKVFADVLHPMVKQDDARDETEAQKNEVAMPNMQQYESLKAKHPEAILLFRCGDKYECYREDAQKVSEIVKNDMFQRVNPKTGEQVDMFDFPYTQLDSYLPQIIRCGNRVAICDQLDAPKTKVANAESGQKKGNSTESCGQEEQRRGMHI